MKIGFTVLFDRNEQRTPGLKDFSLVPIYLVAILNPSYVYSNLLTSVFDQSISFLGFKLGTWFNFWTSFTTWHGIKVLIFY